MTSTFGPRLFLIPLADAPPYRVIESYVQMEG